MQELWAAEPGPQFEQTQPDAVPAVVGSLFLQLSDVILGTVVFFFAVQQQNELDKSAHYAAIMAAIVLAVIIFQAMQERVRSTVALRNYRRHALGRVVGKLLFLVIAYLTGLLSRTLSNSFTSGPRRGHFDMLSLVMPVVAIVLFVARIYHMSMISSHRAEITAALAAMRRQPATRHNGPDS